MAGGTYVGSLENSLANDFVDGTVWNSPANYIAIVRHDGSGTCAAARVWRLVSSDLSMRTIFEPSSSYQRSVITDGGVLQDVQNTVIANDPFFGVGADIVANWWYSNNGARLAMDKPETGGGEPLSAVCEDCNNDAIHGLGNEFGGHTHSGGYAQATGPTTWWHDASVIQPLHSSTVQGTDHGTSLSDGTKLGNYAIYVSANAYDAPAPVICALRPRSLLSGVTVSVRHSTPPPGSDAAQLLGTSFGTASLGGGCPSGASSGVSTAPGAAGVTTLGGSKVHCYGNINDGEFGNSYSWIPGVAGAVAGITFASPVTLTGLGTSRNRLGYYADRTGSLEVEVYASGATTDYSVLTGTGGWVSLGSASLARYAGYYAFSELVTVDAIRVKASNAQLCLDELELYGTTIP